VKDPREVAKPGDIVKVKVLEVDKARKRVALTMRLDDDAARAPQRDAGARTPQRPQQNRGPQQSSRPGGQGGGNGALGGALAEALARAQSQKGR
jgi:uncharacterized protein